MTEASSARVEELLDRALPIARQAASGAKYPLTFEDLFSATQEAAWEAARKWDGRGRFESFAASLIKQRKTDEFRKLDELSRSHRRRVKSGQEEAPRRVGTEIAEAEQRTPSWRQSPPEAVKNPLPRKPAPRQMQAWKLVADGMTDRQIAGRLGIRTKSASELLIYLRRRLLIPQGSRIDLARLYRKRQTIVWDVDLRPMTAKQRTVWKFVAEGVSTKEIAYLMQVTRGRVDMMIRTICKRLGVQGGFGSRLRLAAAWDKSMESDYNPKKKRKVE